MAGVKKTIQKPRCPRAKRLTPEMAIKVGKIRLNYQAWQLSTALSAVLKAVENGEKLHPWQRGYTTTLHEWLGILGRFQAGIQGDAEFLEGMKAGQDDLEEEEDDDCY